MSKCESEMYIGKTRASLEIIFDFDDIWCRSWKLNDLTDNDIPNKLYYDMCSRKFLKDLKEECEGKKEEKFVRVIVYLDDMMNVASYAYRKNGLFSQKKKKGTRR